MVLGRPFPFHVVNFRTDIQFVFFLTPVVLKSSSPLSFATPNSPLHGHLSSLDSAATSIRFCLALPRTLALHDPGYIHSAVMTGLQPSTSYSYKYGRPMYTSNTGIFDVDFNFVKDVEPLLLNNEVEPVLFAHVHNFERTCSVYQGKCKDMPKKDAGGIDIYDHSRYATPVQVVIGMARFSLDVFNKKLEDWSLVRISKFGYVRAHVTLKQLTLQFVDANEDSFGGCHCCSGGA